MVTAAHIYNYISVRHLKWKTPWEIFLGNKSKTSHFHIFGCGADVFLPSEVYANKLVSYSKLMIFIGYEDNSYYFICHIQINIIFHSTLGIFDEKLFSKIH